MRRDFVITLVWLALAVGGCFGFTGNLREHVWPLGLWLVLAVGAVLVHRRVRLLEWPGELIFWATAVLIVGDLFWIKYGLPY